ncbi:hypothetical protein ACBI99_35720 [Nonomuraea sp. ATR24]|uniref:hypothetical protein n=1 Tax=Nonomuraea TaxID=83681 RepID=UPI001C5F7217|nr:hypothetical protein [Nonomuraea ceibae]
MLFSLVRAQLAACAMVTLMTAPARCDEQDRTGERGRVSEPRCFMEVLHQTVSVSAAGIGATLKYWCDLPPVRHRISLRLQTRDTNGRWVTMDERTDRRVPVPEPQTLTVAVPCFPGLWRARGTAVGALRADDGRVQEFEPAQKDSAERLVSTDECGIG